MSKEQNYGVKDPEINIELTEDEEYIESQIVYNGKLTAYGEKLYEESKEAHYDEETGEWIYV